METLQRIVIVGGSAAGVSAADALREGGFDGEVTLLSAEVHMPYDKPSLSKQILTTEEARPQGYPLRDADHYANNRIGLELGARATKLDDKRRIVHTADGRSFSYDGLVIASGCRARTFSTTTGKPLPTIRTLDDAFWLKEHARQARKAVVIGTGFIGLEVAASLTSLGIAVTVVGASARVLERSFGPEMAGYVERLHAENGVSIVTGTSIRTVTETDGRYEVTLDDGRVLETELVIVGIGVECNTEWLSGSGVNLADGVLCDSAGFTSVANVVAAGDVACAFHPLYQAHTRIEHWTNAIEQGRTAALNLVLGERKPYGAVPYFWTDQFGYKFQSYGRILPGDEMVVVEGGLDSEQFVALYGSASGFHCAVSLGQARSLRGYRKLLNRRATWAEALGDRAVVVGNSLVSMGASLTV